MSILCLIFYRWAKMREWLGHSIFIYTLLAMVSYYLEIENHDGAFQNDMLGIFGVSMALYIMTMMSYALLREKRKWETHELKAS